MFVIFEHTEPAFYKQGYFGVRLENVLEVIDTQKRHPSGARFLRFKELTLVPYEAKLIDRSLLSTQEVMRDWWNVETNDKYTLFVCMLQKRWLNDYNARIRELVGDELKAQMNMQAFYWMMNKTSHIIEYYPESEYRKNNGSTILSASMYAVIAVILMFLARWSHL